MLWTASIRILLCVTAMTLALAASADASPLVRTFISNTGVDANAGTTGCVVTAPCRTLSGAYGNTEAGGEIVMMTPGGYGCLTIGHALSIIGTDGATSTATSGACLVISAGATDTIFIRNIQITGANQAGTIGVQLNTGNLVLENSSLKFLGTGVSVTNAKASLFHVDLIGNTVGVSASGTGVNTSNFPLTGTTEVLLFWGNALYNTTAYSMTNPGTNNMSILEYLTDGSASAYSTGMAGNGTLVSGTGTGCPCGGLGTFLQTGNPN